MRHLSIFNFKKREVALFIGATILISFFVIGVFELVFLRLGETLPYTKVIQQQNVSEVYYLPKYFNVSSQYKIEGARHKIPEILAIGTSRIMPMSQDHVPYGKFYNAGVDASSSREIDGMLHILRSLEDDKLPRTVIIGIDPWLFNPNYLPNQENLKSRINQLIRGNNFLDGLYFAYQFVTQRAAGYDLLLGDKSNWFRYLSKDPNNGGIGTNAKLLNAGFSSDGSFHFPKFKRKYLYSPAEWEEWLMQDQYRFVEAVMIDQKVLTKFEEFLKYCREKNVKVIGLLLPFRDDFYRAINISKKYSVFFNKFREIIPQTMNTFGYYCYDFSSPETLSLTKNDFIDMYHVKRSSFEKIASRIFNDESIKHANGKAILEVVGQ